MRRVIEYVIRLVRSGAASRKIQDGDSCLSDEEVLKVLGDIRKDMPLSSNGTTTDPQEIFRDEKLLERCLSALEAVADANLAKMPQLEKAGGELRIIELPGAICPEWAEPPMGSPEFAEYLARMPAKGE